MNGSPQQEGAPPGLLLSSHSRQPQVAPNSLLLAWILEYAFHFNAYRIVDSFAADNNAMLFALLEDLPQADKERSLVSFSAAMLVNLLRNPRKLATVAPTDVIAYLDTIIAAAGPSLPQDASSLAFCISCELKTWLAMHYARVNLDELFADVIARCFAPDVPAESLLSPDANTAAAAVSDSDAAALSDLTLKRTVMASLRDELMTYACHIGVLRDLHPLTVAAASAAAAAAAAATVTAGGGDAAAAAAAAAAAVPTETAESEEDRRTRAAVAAAATAESEALHGRDLVLTGVNGLTAAVRQRHGWSLEPMQVGVSELFARAQTLPQGASAAEIAAVFAAGLVDGGAATAVAAAAAAAKGGKAAPAAMSDT